MASEKIVAVLGQEYRIVSEVVEVVATDVRSDTHVSGGGHVYGSGGYVIGSSSTSSKVAITRNVWFRRPDGSEGHWAFRFDLPVRAGHHLQLLTLSGPRTARYVGRDTSGKKDRYEFAERVGMSVRIEETADVYKLGAFRSDGSLHAVELEPHDTWTDWALVWGVLLLLFYGIGAILLAWWAIRMVNIHLFDGRKAYGISEKEATKRAEEIRAAIRAAYEDALQDAPNRQTRTA
jgi:hypothetical protein